jgi:Ala-tRNA(Pro) deacylase
MNVHEFLQQHEIEHETFAHSPTYDAQRLAQAVDETGHHVAKTVLLKSETDYLLAVVPATHTVDLESPRLRKSGHRELASEDEVIKQFPDCEPGAIPPFGSQYGIHTIVDTALCEAKQIVFESNTHDEAIRMRFTDYIDLERPVVTHVSREETH